MSGGGTHRAVFDESIEGAYRRLAAPGRLNEEMENLLQETNFADVELPYGQECALCKAPKYPFSADESIFLQDEEHYVVEALTRKQHDVRNMVVATEHRRIPEEKSGYKEDLKRITAGHIRDGYMIVFGSMNSFPDHWHLIASDLEGRDLEHIHDYELYRVEDGGYEHLDSRIQTNTAKALLQD